MKYIHLGAGSWVKGQNDRLKYEKAKKLKGMIEDIRKDYEQKLTSSKDYRRECGTIVYLIDRLALRVGNDKDDEEEADTVGCCSLRHEHIKFPDLDTVKEFYKEEYKKSTKQGEALFQLEPGDINDYLKKFMKDLSA